MAGVADFALRIGSTAILARLLLPEYFGLVMMVMAVTAVADQFRDLGLSTVTVQRKEITHEEITNLFWINALAGTLIALIVCAASPLISLYYKDSRLTLITCILASSFVFGGLMVQHQALLARVLKLGHSAAVRVLASLISTLLAVFLAWKGFGYWALVWREVARGLLLTGGMWLCFRWIPGLPSWRTDVRGLLGFGAHLSAANILGSISGGVDRFLLGRFSGAGPVAMYRQAFQLLVAPMDQLLSPIYQVTQPGLSMLQTEAARFRRFYQKVLTLVCVATMPLSLFVAVYSAEITRVMLGRKWLEAAPLLMILSFDAFIKQAVGSAAFILITTGRSKSYLGLTMLHNATLVLLMCVGVRWGAKGIALCRSGHNICADRTTPVLLPQGFSNYAPRLLWNDSSAGHRQRRHGSCSRHCPSGTSSAGGTGFSRRRKRDRAYSIRGSLGVAARWKKGDARAVPGYPIGAPTQAPTERREPTGPSSR